MKYRELYEISTQEYLKIENLRVILNYINGKKPCRQVAQKAIHKMLDKYNYDKNEKAVFIEGKKYFIPESHLLLIPREVVWDYYKLPNSDYLFKCAKRELELSRLK